MDIIVGTMLRDDDEADERAEIHFYKAPNDAHQVEDWHRYVLFSGGRWIRNIHIYDVNDDGWNDIVFVSSGASFTDSGMYKFFSFFLSVPRIDVTAA
jgi:hypothetical protein